MNHQSTVFDVADWTVALRGKAGLSQRNLARKLKTSQQNISRLESTSYEGHSLGMLRRVAEVLGATLRVTIAAKRESSPMILSEPKVHYRTGRKS